MLCCMCMPMCICMYTTRDEPIMFKILHIFLLRITLDKAVARPKKGVRPHEHVKLAFWVHAPTGLLLRIYLLELSLKAILAKIINENNMLTEL